MCVCVCVCVCEREREREREKERESLLLVKICWHVKYIGNSTCRPNRKNSCNSSS